MSVRILVIEDDSSLLDLLREELEAEAYQVTTAQRADEGIQLCHEWEPDLVVSDLRLPDGDGMAVLRETQTVAEPPLFVLITAFGTVDQAVDALKAGADEFLTKPLSMDHLLLMIRRLLDQRALRREVDAYRASGDAAGFHGIIGGSDPMHRLYDQIRQVATGAMPVLVLGESGVGKELVARAIHAESPRAEQPFVAVNCAGIPADLMESEFFGHARGAFTGADRARTGLFGQADGGTLLLDEIAEMPMALQAKLLRALQENQVTQVGGEGPIQVDVRILAATNRSLKELVEKGRFREDLYYRLNVLPLTVPPLRERKEDISLLAQHFLQFFCGKEGREIKDLTPQVVSALEKYSWPGNVRELKNLMERLVIMVREKLITLDHLPAVIARASPSKPESPETAQQRIDKDSYKEARESFEKEFIEQKLLEHEWNISKTSEAIEMERSNLHRKIKALGIQLKK